MPDFVSGLVKSTAGKRSVSSGSKAKTSQSAETAHQGLTREQLAAVRDYLVHQGLFDSAFYLTTYGDVAGSGVDAFQHFFLHGHQEGRRPNSLFDTTWYLQNNPDAVENRVNPLLHYARIGEPEGRRPNAHFDPVWYRK